MRASPESSKLWVRAHTLRRAKYAQILQVKPDEFSPEYFMRVDSRRSAAARLRLIAFVFQIFLFALFAFSLHPHQKASVILQGTSINDFREILLIISAVLGLAIPAIGHYHDVLVDILTASLERRSEGDEDIVQLLRISYGIDLFPVPPEVGGNLSLGPGYRFFITLFVSLAAVAVAIVMLGALFVRFKVLEDIYFSPGYSEVVSACVIGFVILTDLLGSFIFILSVGPLRVRSHEAISEPQP